MSIYSEKYPDEAHPLSLQVSQVIPVKEYSPKPLPTHPNNQKNKTNLEQAKVNGQRRFRDRVACEAIRFSWKEHERIAIMLWC